MASATPRRRTLETLSPPGYTHVLSALRLPELQFTPVVTVELIAYDSGEKRCRESNDHATVSPLFDAEDAVERFPSGVFFFHVSNQAQNFLLVLDYEVADQLEDTARLNVRGFGEIGRRDAGCPHLIVRRRIGGNGVRFDVTAPRFALHGKNRMFPMT